MKKHIVRHNGRMVEYTSNRGKLNENIDGIIKNFIGKTVDIYYVNKAGGLTQRGKGTLSLDGDIVRVDSYPKFASKLIDLNDLADDMLFLNNDGYSNSFAYAIIRLHGNRYVESTRHMKEAQSPVEEVMSILSADDLDELIIDIFADAMYAGTEWIYRVKTPVKSEVEDPTVEDDMLASLKAGKLTFVTEDGNFTPSYDDFARTFDRINKEFPYIMETFRDDAYDSLTSDAVLQIWVLGDYIYG